MVGASRCVRFGDNDIERYCIVRHCFQSTGRRSLEKGFEIAVQRSATPDGDVVDEETLGVADLRMGAIAVKNHNGEICLLGIPIEKCPERAE